LADHWVKKSLAHIIIKKTTCLLKFSTHFETPRALAQLTQRTLMVQHQAGAATPRRSAQSVTGRAAEAAALTLTLRRAVGQMRSSTNSRMLFTKDS
jgi:hypothetical protein